MALAITESAGNRVLEVGLDLDTAVDVAGLSPAELGDLERELLADVKIAVGLSTSLRNRRMRERGPLAA